MAHYTIGPWRFIDDRIVNKDGLLIADLSKSDFEGRERHLNKFLVAAAPDVRGVLRSVLADLTRESGLDDDTRDSMIAKITTALARAEGTFTGT